MKVELREITKDNYLESVNLKVKPGQDEFVAPNVFSIVQSKFYSSWKPIAIYSNGEMVGFLMYGMYCEDDLKDGGEKIWIIRLMIEDKYQGKGYGKEAMIKLIENIKNDYEQKEIFVSFVPANSGAKKLYEKLGFEDTGRMDEDELVYSLKL